MDIRINHKNGKSHDNDITNLSQIVMYTDRENRNRRLFSDKTIQQGLEKLSNDIIHGRFTIVDKDEKSSILDHAPLYIHDHIKEDDGKELTDEVPRK